MEKEKDELIDSHVSLHQLKKAVEALHSHQTKVDEKRQANQLISGKEQNVWLNVTVKRIQSTHKFKPVKIPIVHPIVDPRVSSVCLITKDPQREYKDLLESHGIKFISRVVGIEKLKGKFKPFEARRMLLKENDMFLADERVIPILPKLLGRKWFEAKKQPIPVCLTRKDLKGELERAISSTYMHQNQGTQISIKMATLSQKPSQVVANIVKGLPYVVKHIHEGWDNVQSLHIKTNSSVSLPVWTCNLGAGEGGRWEGMTATAEEKEKVEEGSDDEKSAVEASLPPAKSKGKKRASDDQEEEKPKKKSKTATADVTPAPGKTESRSRTRETGELPKAKDRKGTSGNVSASAAAKSAKANRPTSSPTVSSRASKPSETAQLVASDSSAKSKKKQTGDKLVPVKPSSTASSQPKGSAEPRGVAPSKQSNKDKPRDTALTPKTTTSKQNPISSGPAKKSPTKDTGKGAPSAVKDVSQKAASMSQSDIQQKRAAIAGEKKKEKVAKGKGKSVKDKLLGKKAAVA